MDIPTSRTTIIINITIYRPPINLDKFMKERGYSLNYMAEICDLTKNTLRSIKNNQGHSVGIKSLALIADALDCSIEDLIDDQDWIMFYEKIMHERSNNPLYF